MDRRHLLQLAASTAGTLWLPRSAWSQVRFTDDPFGLGVASGAPTHDTVLLWTRLAPAAMVDSGGKPVTVQWQLADDVNFRQGVRSGQTTAVAELGYSVHVEVPALAPDRWYHYRFMAGDAVSAVGRTRTFPLPSAPAQRLRLAYASCQRWEDGYFSAWRHMQVEHLDVVLFLGDYLYEYPGTGSKVRVPPGGWVLTLDDYRARYALYKSDAGLQAMHAACPWLLAWDDHEVENDYAGLQAGSSGLDAVTFARRRAAAYQAYYENMPLPLSALTRALQGLGEGAEMRLYGQLSFGRLAQLYLLDGRQYKDPQVCTKGGKQGGGTLDPTRCAAWNDPARSFLGMAQERWLAQSLAGAAQRQTTWNVLGQSTLLGTRNFGTAQAPRLWNDGWDGYGAARQRLVQALQQPGVANPVVLGGDVHENWVGHVKADYARADSANVGVEFCGTSITSHAGKGDTAAVLAQNPHFVFADSAHRGYGVVEFTPTQLTTTLRGLTDVTQADSGIQTLARFTVLPGRPVLEQG